MADHKVTRVDIVSVRPVRKAFKDRDEMVYLAQLNGVPADSWRVLFLNNKGEYQPFWQVGDGIEITCLPEDHDDKVEQLHALVRHVNETLPQTDLPV